MFKLTNKVPGNQGDEKQFTNFWCSIKVLSYLGPNETGKDTVYCTVVVSYPIVTSHSNDQDDLKNFSFYPTD